MKRLALVMGLLLPLSMAVAEVYKWTDEYGRVHFGDAPKTKDNAKSVDLSHINTYDAPSKIFIDKTLARPTDINHKESAKVVIYSTTWCGVCVKAKKWFKANQIKYREYDIETSTKGKRDYKKLKGRGVPIIIVGQQRMNGFSPSRMQQMLDNAKQKNK